ncbi:pleiotropic drug resistance protein 1-like [Hibiscus syriacus]|uniref:RING-type E3 ubiquitin transferase n=1 Tax=Hibiscus syriacus TaxID=106335 RepID=A0A6A2ZWH1_HIBSY|nr:pleiotropic drug resistance protein 1-like [Hibiscus syriacus]
MRSVCLAAVVCLMCEMFILGLTNYVPEVEFEYKKESSVEMEHNYERIDEVKKHCKSVLSSASEFKAGDNRIADIKEELNFGYGDWRQDFGDAPIMPFDDRGIPEKLSQAPSNISSFWITNVDNEHRTKKSVSVSGILMLGITLDTSFAERPYQGSPRFQIWPAHTQLAISFEGIYTETKQGGGERVLCLLGSAMLPSRESDMNTPWEWLKDSVKTKNRVIRGELKSLNPKSNAKYFDQVHILAQMLKSTKYEFGSNEIVSKACDPYPYRDNVMNSGINVYKGDSFCAILEQVTNSGAFTVVPNWKCNGTDDYCSKLGPFVSDKEIKATNGSFKDVVLYMQDVSCKPTNGHRNDSVARVAAVFWAAPASEDQYRVQWRRSGLSNLTLAAEGIWNSSSGQLCMVGCLGIVDADGSSCNSRICLYVPLLFSLKQRSIIFGSISSIDRSNKYFPLSFERLARPTELWNYFRISHPYYGYSKIRSAGAILEKNEPFSFGTLVKKSLLQFPKLDDTEDFLSSLSFLAEDLTLEISSVPDPFSNSHRPRVDIQLDIFSLGPLFGRNWYSRNVTTAEEEAPYHAKAEYTEKQLLLNVSAQLTIMGKDYSNFSVLFLEGLYDPHFGRMYLVGCRDVRASWTILSQTVDLESGLDCLIEVIVSYPPTTARWLVNPTARISISSQRTEDDPLYFGMIKLQTLPIMYRKQREDILSRRGVEGILCVLTLSFAIACISSQLFYLKQDVDSSPFISLVMLGVQAFGYSLPLITGAEALFKREASDSYAMQSYDLEKSRWLSLIDYTVKLLVLVMFLLTLRLCQKVWKSRIRLLSGSPLESHRVPSEKRVLIATVIIHVIGYIIVLIIHTVNTKQIPFQTDKFIDSRGNSQTLRQWEIELEEYIGLVQDFFLLPQVIGNLMCQIDCKPLRKLYFIGITVVRLLPHFYDYMRAPVPNPYFAEEYEFVNPTMDFFSNFGDVAIPVTAVLLAAVVYCQQRWKYDQLSQILTFRQRRLLPAGSRAYERLSSKPLEAELASDVNRSTSNKLGDDDEE